MNPIKNSEEVKKELLYSRINYERKNTLNQELQNNKNKDYRKKLTLELHDFINSFKPNVLTPTKKISKKRNSIKKIQTKKNTSNSKKNTCDNIEKNKTKIILMNKKYFRAWYGCKSPESTAEFTRSG